MRILIIGATGTIGSAVAAALTNRHTLVLASHSKAAEPVDIADPASLRELFARVGRVALDMGRLWWELIHEGKVTKAGASGR